MNKIKRLRLRVTFRNRVIYWFPFWWRWEPKQYNYGFISTFVPNYNYQDDDE